MALKNSKRYQGEMMRNAGIFKIDQVELVAKTSAPSDSDLADSRLYYNSTDKVFYGYANSLWMPFGGATKVTSVTSSTTLTTSQSGQVIKCASVGGTLNLTLPSAATSGLTYYIVQDSVNAATGDLYIQESGYADASHQFIAGASGTFIALNVRGESLILVSDGGTAWLAVARYG